jgi:hypothetical protein
MIIPTELPLPPKMTFLPTKKSPPRFLGNFYFIIYTLVIGVEFEFEKIWESI